MWIIFYNLPQSQKDHLIHNQKHLFKGINQDLIADIYDLIYTKQLTNKDIKITLRTNSELTKVRYEEISKYV